MSNSQSQRQHFGSGALDPHRETSVFINCPFDSEFEPIFDAILFSTVCCGFLPRSALESGSTSIPRMNRITRALLSSKYSIHDLSRCRGEGEANFARFNMPLELGIAMAQRFGGTDGENRHDWLLLVPKGHHYKRFISDLAGFYPKEYDGSKQTIVPAVMSWLATRPEAVLVPTPKIVLQALSEFEKRKNNLFEEWKGEIP